MQRSHLIDRLAKSDEPSVRWKVRVGVLDEDPGSRSIKHLQKKIRDGAWVRALLARRDADGRIHTRRDVYDKWRGARWVFAALADLGYPAGDETLLALRDQVFAHWLRDQFCDEFEATSRQQAYRRSGVPRMQGRYRRCGSQRGNFKPSSSLAHGADYVDWGGTSTKTLNEWITADALCVLHAAGRN